MATPSEMIDKIRRESGETEADYWTSTEIYEYMSDAQRLIGRVVPCVLDSTAQDVIADTREYTIPDDVGIISRVTYDGRKIKAIDINQLGALEDTDSTSTGRPEYYYQWGTEMGLSPVPDSTDELKIYFQKICSDVTNTSSWAVPDWCTDIIPDYCLWRMYTKDQELSVEADSHQKSWLMGLDQLESDWNKRIYDDQYIVVRDEDNTYPGTSLGIT